MTDTLMAEEIAEIPQAAARLLEQGAGAIAAAAGAVRAADPAFVMTVARGSSDHACTYLKYASELLLGLPVASVGPSVASIYGAKLRVTGALCLSVSQSGQSPDIVEMTRAARAGGALTVALTNDAGSRLAGTAERVIDICAGPELSVAATKTFVTSALAGLWLMAEVKGMRSCWPRSGRCPRHWTGRGVSTGRLWPRRSGQGRSTRWVAGRLGRCRTKRR